MNAWNVHILLDDDTSSLSLIKGGVGCCMVPRFPVIDLVCRLLILLIGTKQGSVRCQSFVGIDHYRERVVIDIDGCHSIGGGIAAGGNDECDFLHLEMHAINSQH